MTDLVAGEDGAPVSPSEARKQYERQCQEHGQLLEENARLRASLSRLTKWAQKLAELLTNHADD
jgi:hypothetical protein